MKRRLLLLSWILVLLAGSSAPSQAQEEDFPSMFWGLSYDGVNQDPYGDGVAGMELGHGVSSNLVFGFGLHSYRAASAGTQSKELSSGREMEEYWRYHLKYAGAFAEWKRSARLAPLVRAGLFDAWTVVHRSLDRDFDDSWMTHIHAIFVTLGPGVDVRIADDCSISFRLEKRWTIHEQSSLEPGLSPTIGHMNYGLSFRIGR